MLPVELRLVREIAEALGLGAPEALVLDLPLGSALDLPLEGKVVVTPATSPLYLADLLDESPHALFAGCDSLEKLRTLL